MMWCRARSLVLSQMIVKNVENYEELNQLSCLKKLVLDN